MQTSRRSFLGGAVALFGASSFKLPALAAVTPTLKVGVLSDIHIMHDVPESVTRFRQALEYFRSEDVDAVLVAGDLADHGVIEDLRLVADTWFAVFPENRGKGGKPVEKLFCYGNHDWEGWWYNDYPKKRPDLPESAKLCLDYPGHWECCFKEKFEPIFVKDVKGYKFVGAHFDNFVGPRGLDGFLALHRKELEGKKPFFFFEHMHPRNTCSAPWVWGQDYGGSEKALAAFPNCISFSGHSHTTLTDERVIWQGDFTSVGTASLSYVCSFSGRENYRQINPVEHQGQLMTVYPSHVELERRDFARGESLGVWVIPLPFVKESAPYSFAMRQRHAPAPYFERESKVEAWYDAAAKRFKVKVPAARASAPNVRVWDYEIAVAEQVMDYERTVSSRRLYAPAFMQAPAREPNSFTLTYKTSDLPKGKPFRFVVRAFECFGHASAPLASATFAQVAEKSGVIKVHLDDTARYEWIHAAFPKAFAFLKRPDLATLPVGRYDIDGEKCYAMIQECEPVAHWEKKPLKLEYHRRYIDIQFPIGNEETFGNYFLSDEERKTLTGFDVAKDVGFLERVTWADSIRPGECVIFFPGTGAHAPCLELDGAKKIRKAVIKVLVN